MEDNSKIQYIELGGNNITEEVLSSINSKLDQNRQRRGGGAEWGGASKTRGFDRSAAAPETKNHFRSQKYDGNRENQELFDDLQKALNANSELERALHIEARKNSELNP